MPAGLGAPPASSPSRGRATCHSHPAPPRATSLSPAPRVLPLPLSPAGHRGLYGAGERGSALPPAHAAGHAFLSLLVRHRSLPGHVPPARHSLLELSLLHDMGFPPLPAPLGTSGWLTGSCQCCAAAEKPQSLWGREKGRNSSEGLWVGVRSCSEHDVGTSASD